jgi:hypothetical protein
MQGIKIKNFLEFNVSRLSLTKDEKKYIDEEKKRIEEEKNRLSKQTNPAKDNIQDS